MDLTAGQRRVEHADHPQRLRAAAQPVLIVLIQGIDHPWHQGELAAIGNGFDLAIALDAPHRLEMVLIVDVGFRPRKNHGFMKGKPHAVLGQQHAAAEPVLGDDFLIRADDVMDVAYDHHAPPATFRTRGWRPWLARTSLVQRSMISSPWISCARGIVSAGRTLSTSS